MSNTITTAAELDALPMGAVVRCDDDEGIGLNVAERQPQGWQHVGSAIHFTSGQLAADEVPFTLIYRPDQPSDAARLRAGIEALADEWGATARAEQSVAANAALPRGVRALADARWEIGEKYVNALRALLSTNDEKETRA